MVWFWWFANSKDVVMMAASQSLPNRWSYIHMSSTQSCCPSCRSEQIVKNGRTHSGKQNHKCRDCGRQFVEDPQHKPIDEATKRLVDRLLLEKLTLAGISRVVEVSEGWLQEYVHGKYKTVAWLVNQGYLKKGPITYEYDWIWHFLIY